MVLPEDIQPVNLGLIWHSSKEQCLSILNQAPFAGTHRYAAFSLSVRDELHKLYLLFDEDSLVRTQLTLWESRDFWEEHTTEEVESISDEYEQEYRTLIGEYVKIYGTPAFSGLWTEPGYPKAEVADYLTCWEVNGDRLQVEFDQPDTEFPFVVRLACYPRIT